MSCHCFITSFFHLPSLQDNNWPHGEFFATCWNPLWRAAPASSCSPSPTSSPARLQTTGGPHRAGHRGPRRPAWWTWGGKKKPWMRMDGCSFCVKNCNRNLTTFLSFFLMCFFCCVFFFVCFGWYLGLSNNEDQFKTNWPFAQLFLHRFIFIIIIRPIFLPPDKLTKLWKQNRIGVFFLY